MSLEWRVDPRDFWIGKRNDYNIFAWGYNLYRHACDIGYVFFPRLSSLEQEAKAVEELLREESESPLEVKVEEDHINFHGYHGNRCFLMVCMTPQYIKFSVVNPEGKSVLDMATQLARRFEEFCGSEGFRGVPSTVTRQVNYFSPCCLDRFRGVVGYRFFREQREIVLEKIALLKLDKSPLWEVNLYYSGKSGPLSINISKEAVLIDPVNPPLAPLGSGTFNDPFDSSYYTKYLRWAGFYQEDLSEIENSIISELPTRRPHGYLCTPFPRDGILIVRCIQTFRSRN